MAGVHHNSEEYSRKTQLEEEPTNLERVAHTIQRESNAATKEISHQAVRNAITNARICQENEDFGGIVRLCLGCESVEEVVNSDRDDDVVVFGGDDAAGKLGNNTQCARASSLGAQLTARGDRGGDVGRCLAKRALLEQSLAESAAKNSDGDNHSTRERRRKMLDTRMPRRGWTV